MKRIAIIGSMFLASVVAEKLVAEHDYGIIVVIGDELDVARPVNLHFDLIGAIETLDYVAEETGEVVPDFVPGKIGEEKGFTADIFHPPIRCLS